MTSGPRRFNMLLLVHVVRHHFINDVDNLGVTMKTLADDMNKTAKLLQIDGNTVDNDTVFLLLKDLDAVQKRLSQKTNTWEAYCEQNGLPALPQNTVKYSLTTPRALLADLLGFTFTVENPERNGLPRTVHFKACGTLNPGAAAALARLAADYPFLQDDQAATLIRDLTMACGAPDASFFTQGRGKSACGTACGVNLFANIYRLERIMELLWGYDPLRATPGQGEEPRAFLYGDEAFRDKVMEAAGNVPGPHFLLTTFTYCRWAATEKGKVVLQPAKDGKRMEVVPCRLMFSNGYYYLACFRPDLDVWQDGKPVLSNLRLDRMRDIFPKWKRCDKKEFAKMVRVKQYCSDLRDNWDDITHRNAATVMYAGTPVKELRLYLLASLLNNAVDDFGAANLRATPLPPAQAPDARAWLAVTVTQCVWGGAKQFIMQHADGCCIAKDADRTDLRSDLTATLTAALTLQNR